MIICSPELGLSPESNLGGEVHDREMLSALADSGVQIDIVLPYGKDHGTHKNWKFYFLPTPIVYPPWLFNILVIPYLFFLYYKDHFRVLRIHSTEFVGTGAVFFKLFYPNIKIVATFHHLDSGSINFSINRLLAKHFDLISVATQSEKKKYMENFNVNQEKIIVIAHGISDKYIPKRKNSELLEKHGLFKQKILLYLGQLSARKNISFLLDVLNNLPTNYSLVIAGDGDEKEKLMKKAKELSLGRRVIFTGRLSEAIKVDYYNLADVFVFPSILEGFGMTIVEAQRCQKVVIVSPDATFSSFVEDGKTGLVEELDPKKWANRIISILKDKPSFELITSQAMKNAQKYTWAAAAKKYINSINEL